MSGNWAAGFLRSQMSDKDGTVSNTKVLTALTISNALSWIGALLTAYIVTVTLKRGVITMTDVVTFMGAASIFVVSLVGTIGGIKATADAINNRAPNASAQVQPPENPCPDGASGTLSTK